ncbi:MAG: hypothetical protein L0Y32_01660 [Nevskiales bacterium]|nr:hypothetical protein [Nevskiales bacterium]
MTKSIIFAGLCVLALSMIHVQPAHAGGYASAGAGSSLFGDWFNSSDPVDPGTASRFAIGYERNTGSAYFELAYLDSGDADITANPGAGLGAEMNISAMGLTVGSRHEARESWLFRATTTSFYKIGLYLFSDTEVSGFGFADSGNTGLLLGGGSDYLFTPHLGLRIEIEYLASTEDFGFGNSNHLMLVTIGPVIRFGGQ